MASMYSSHSCDHSFLSSQLFHCPSKTNLIACSVCSEMITNNSHSHDNLFVTKEEQDTSMLMSYVLLLALSLHSIIEVCHRAANIGICVRCSVFLCISLKHCEIGITYVVWWQGFTLGLLQEVGSLIALFIAIIAHKGLAAFALGTNLVKVAYFPQFLISSGLSSFA